MKAEPRGWCPGVHAPMAVADGLLVRVKPRLSRLGPAAARAVALAAGRFGNGVIELTSRANLQLRGVTDPAGLAAAMVAAGLADPDPGRERRRNIVVAPFAGQLAERLALALEAALAEAALAALPDKFGFSIDTGRYGIGAHRADIRILLDRGVWLAADGGAAWASSQSDVVEAAIGLARAFLYRRGPDERRMRQVVARGGILAPGEVMGPWVAPEARDAGKEGVEEVAPPDGRLDGATLLELAGRGTLHLTTRRSLLWASA